MPKKLENVRETLLEETRRQIEENGYSAMTIRSVAAACGVGVGTVYNYFKSKDQMTAPFMLDDWNKCLADMREFTDFREPAELIRFVYEKLNGFMLDHAGLFEDAGAKDGFAAGFFKWHKVLRGQLAQIIAPACSKREGNVKGAQNVRNTYDADEENGCSDFLPDFIAESLLTWCGEGMEYERLAPVVNLLIGSQK